MRSGLLNQFQQDFFRLLSTHVSKNFVKSNYFSILKGTKLEPVYCKKRQKKAHDQLLVWEIGDLQRF